MAQSITLNPNDETRKATNRRNKKCARYCRLVLIILALTLVKISVDRNKIAVNDKTKKIREFKKSTNSVSPDAKININNTNSVAGAESEQKKANELEKSSDPVSPKAKIILEPAKKMSDKISANGNRAVSPGTEIHINGTTPIAGAESEQKKANELEKSPDPVPPKTKIILEPAFGSHRPDANAIFTTAHGYKLFEFIVFFETLRDTGYDGDVVLSVNKNETKKIIRYLRSRDNVVVYMPTLECTMDLEGIVRSGRKVLACQFLDLYGDDRNGKPIPDPRKMRSIVISRFELYYTWSLQYSPKSLIFVSDFRDSFFQKNPVAELPLDDNASLYFFEERRHKNVLYGVDHEWNHQVMLETYGKDFLNQIKGKTIICVAWSAGKTPSMQIYLAAIIKEFDETQCNYFGCDQQFHNYLVYSNKLFDLYKRNVRLFRQGEGLVNNLSILGADNLKSLGILNAGKVLNWDGSLSPIVHEYTWCKELKKEMMRRYLYRSHVFKH